MKLLSTTILTFLFAMTVASAQTVFVNSPENLAGVYTFGTASFGLPLTDTVITADVVFVDDGTGETASQGCQAATNGAELDGKIALIDRGSCEFGLKALNAEMAGAIGFIIFNNAPGAGVITMGGGANGGSVTIPGAMLDYEAGQAIRSALEQGAVNVTMGNLRFDNDVAISVVSALHAPTGIMPLSQLGDLTIVPGARINNIGRNEATGVNLSAAIDYRSFDGSVEETIYQEAASVEGALAVDSTTELILLPEVAPANGLGTYTTTYETRIDGDEESTSDNELSSVFTISENLWSKASWNPATGNPRSTTGYTVAGGGDVEFLSTFNIPFGADYKLDSVVFFVSTSAPSLANMTLSAYIYEWDDANEDGAFANDEINIVGLAETVFPEETTATSATLRLPILNFITFEETGIEILEDDKDYIIGIRYVGDELVFLGFDETVDYTQYLEYRTETGTLTDRDYGYLLVTGYNDFVPDFEGGLGLFTDLAAASSAGLILTSTVSTKEVVGPEVFELELFPNPATDYLQANIAFKQQTAYVEYHITDAQGRLFFNTRDNEVSDTEQAQFDLKALPSGQYFLTIRTEQGLQAKPFVVKR